MTRNLDGRLTRLEGGPLVGHWARFRRAVRRLSDEALDVAVVDLSRRVAAGPGTSAEDRRGLGAEADQILRALPPDAMDYHAPTVRAPLDLVPEARS